MSPILLLSVIFTLHMFMFFGGLLVCLWVCGGGVEGWGQYPGLGTFSSAGQVLKEVCFNHPNSSSYQAKSSDHSTIGSRVEQKLLTFQDNIVIQFDSFVSSGNSLDVFHTPKKNNSNCCLCETLEEV